MIKHILVPTDGSRQSFEAAVLAGDFARALRARVTVLTVLDDAAMVAAAWGSTDGAFLGPEGDTSIESVRGQMEKNAHDHLLPETAAKVGELAKPAELACVWGHAASGICDYADRNAVDLIVMGSHGRSGVKAMLLGSVSHAVANRAPCAVTVVR